MKLTVLHSTLIALWFLLCIKNIFILKLNVDLLISSTHEPLVTLYGKLKPSILDFFHVLRLRKYEPSLCTLLLPKIV
jgi:hypothetical protein